MKKEEIFNFNVQNILFFYMIFLCFYDKVKLTLKNPIRIFFPRIHIYVIDILNRTFVVKYDFNSIYSFSLSFICFFLHKSRTSNRIQNWSYGSKCVSWELRKSRFNEYVLKAVLNYKFIWERPKMLFTGPATFTQIQSWLWTMFVHMKNKSDR